MKNHHRFLSFSYGKFVSDYLLYNNCFLMLSQSCGIGVANLFVTSMSHIGKTRRNSYSE